VKFGGFMYFQNRGVDTTRLYDEHLAEIELMEALGFDEVWLAEHHFSYYGMLPSPNLILANLAARTRRLRMGAMILTLPFYEPIRLAEELTMLDHLSHGRLNVGIGSGVAREFVRRGLAVEDAKPRFFEAFDALIGAFTQERLEHDGQFWHYHDAPLEPRPLQQPFPPFYVAASSAETIRWSAERGLPIAQMNAATAGVRQAFATYRAALGSGNGTPRLGTPSVRLFRPTYVAETTEQALAEAERAYFRHFQLFSTDESSEYATPTPDNWRYHTGKALRRLGPHTFQEFDADNYVIVGDPERVAAKLQSFGDMDLEAYVGNFAFGTLTHAQVTRSLRLFGEEVMPRLGAVPAAAPA
jgi:alkanesulfonate monooxygenase SsuD/methylene tetrahydromethanopterin reductase-like flavin-dependent oxidoreductase (luciferase family)